MKTSLTAERVRELLDYCPNTGKFHWKTHRNSQAIQGQEAGHLSKDTGYLILGVDAMKYQAHRVVWLHHYGAWPLEDLDHINHDRADNRICNLRVVNDAVNLRNKSKSKANSSGYTGVYQIPTGNWLARICVNRKQINLGTFPKIEHAIAARKAAEAQHNFHANHGL